MIFGNLLITEFIIELNKKTGFWFTQDMSEMATILVESYEESGPFGAKNITEIGINGVLPAIANAINDAVGVRLHHALFTAEKILNAIKQLEKEKMTDKIIV